MISNAFVCCRATAYVCIIQIENIYDSILSDTCTYNALRMHPSRPERHAEICTPPFMLPKHQKLNPLHSHGSKGTKSADVDNKGGGGGDGFNSFLFAGAPFLKYCFSALTTILLSSKLSVPLTPLSPAKLRIVLSHSSCRSLLLGSRLAIFFISFSFPALLTFTNRLKASSPILALLAASSLIFRGSVMRSGSFAVHLYVCLLGNAGNPFGIYDLVFLSSSPSSSGPRIFTIFLVLESSAVASSCSSFNFGTAMGGRKCGSNDARGSENL
jgi:hypothetical protein